MGSQLSHAAATQQEALDPTLMDRDAGLARNKPEAESMPLLLALQYGTSAGERRGPV